MGRPASSRPSPPSVLLHRPHAAPHAWRLGRNDLNLLGTVPPAAFAPNLPSAVASVLALGARRMTQEQVDLSTMTMTRSRMKWLFQTGIDPDHAHPRLGNPTG
jgi:hypothetical protein